MFALACEVIGVRAAQAATAAQTLLFNLWLWQAQATPTPDPQAATVQTTTTTTTTTAPPPETSVNWMIRFWNNYLNQKLEIGDTLKVSVASLTMGVLILLAAWIVSRMLRRLLEGRLAARTHLDPGLQFTLLRLTHYVIITVGIILAASVGLNANFTSVAVLFTALSVGIGFGLQFIAGDIASGFILLFERPARIGDFVTITGPDSRITEGRVQSINLRTTAVLTNDRITVIVPNSKLVNDNLVNWSYADRRSRISVPVGVAYNSDVDLVSDTLLRASEGITHVLPEPKPSVQFLGFGESSLDFRLLVWTDRPRRHPQIKSDINYRIWRLFKEANIEIPFPQRDLNLRSAALRLTAPDGRHLLLTDAGEADEEHEANLARG
ncbi:MAG TPA: mechanosensitive ion channel domain-containing protein [Pyrinomonadaceae bacterium]|nr:mechanosensitive ion channel domain-containing protein [Pyrinomonadaceae bacterium]